MRRFVSFLILSILALSSAFLAAGWQQNSEATQTSESVRSLFEGDPCAPPCWFGLTAGESTAEDVIATFRSHPEQLRSLDDLSEIAEAPEYSSENGITAIEFVWGQQFLVNLTRAPSVVIV